MLKNVTVTGVDDKTDLVDLMDLSIKYPFVEWGVLISKASLTEDSANERFPDVSIFNKLTKCKRIMKNLNFSLHVCGSYLKDIICDGIWNLDKDTNNNLSTFSRIQLNASQILSKVNLPVFSESLKNINQEVILQIKSFDGNEELVETCRKNAKISVLYDTSGGRGLKPNSWPNSVINCGYAGGLNPENVTDSLLEISKVVSHEPIWIDAETGLRTNDYLDLEKVKEFLSESSWFVKSCSER